ncbi:MAG: hypothetical protein HY548_02280, partial [Elusimicrobia bacterium]|nr:hypothetical protein [Elusimicrobiota bacterium]
TLLYEEAGEVRRVSAAKPLPVIQEPLLKTASVELIGSQAQTLITPAPGKRIMVKGLAIITEPATVGEAVVSFSGGKVLYKVFRGDQSGHIPMQVPGAVGESVQVQTVGFTAGQSAFFMMNYLEETA